jgi:plasmid stabilization system protein ParE
MSLPVRLTDEAVQEIADIQSSYNDARDGLGDEFEEELFKLLLRVADNPRTYAVVRDNIRLAKTARFPYLVVYRMEEYEVVVLVICHTSRNPRSWQDRL